MGSLLDYDPFAVYGKKKMACFVEDILMRYAVQNQEEDHRKVEDDI